MNAAGAKAHHKIQHHREGARFPCQDYGYGLTSCRLLKNTVVLNLVTGMSLIGFFLCPVQKECDFLVEKVKIILQNYQEFGDKL